MIVELSDRAKNAMMNTLSAMMDGGRIELLTDDKVKLAELELSNPATKDASGGEIQFNKIKEEDAAVALGTATWARIIGKDGDVLMVDVGDPQSDAVLKLNTVSIYPNGPVRIKSLRLALP